MLETAIDSMPGIMVNTRVYGGMLLHPASATGVIVLTSSVCVCLSVCYHSHGRTDKHTDLIFGVYVKWKNI